jgi:hypothetical protein
MPWTWDEIQRTCLRDESTTSEPEVWVECLNRLERHLGREWIDESLIKGGAIVSGLMPTLALVSKGARLACLDDVSDTDQLLRKLRANEPSAWSELTAIWLLKSDVIGIDVELEPVLAGGRMPDFRIRHDESAWTYVEVTRPDISEERGRLTGILTQLSGLLTTVTGRYAVEIFLNRAATSAELQEIERRIPDFSQLPGVSSQELPDGLGRLYLNETAPGLVVTENRGDDARPRLGQAQLVIEDGEAVRQIAVRLSFSDDRADAFLRTEARQLPTDAPSLIMIDTSNTSGGLTMWPPLLAGRLQPTIHTRVSGISLFETHVIPTEDSFVWRAWTEQVVNPHAIFQLQPWIESNLGRFPRRP